MIRYLLVFLLLFSSCYRASRDIEPNFEALAHPREIAKENRTPLVLPTDFSLSPFPPLTAEEQREDWGKEYKIALSFAADFDLYRAITAFKRALVLLPNQNKERREEIEYTIALSYYLGKKYGEAIYEVESGSLVFIDEHFPAFADLLVILYDSYDHLGREKEREHILSLIEKEDAFKGERLHLYESLSSANFPELERSAKKKASVENLLCGYRREAKSVGRAELLNAVLPGAGYWYVGQKETAVTAFLINSLFIGAAVIFIHHGNGPAALITLSLESGWYFGGIYGGGLAAKYYNERLYERCVEKMAGREKLFPLMMIRYSF